MYALKSSWLGLIVVSKNNMDAFVKLGEAATSTFASTTGYSMADYALYGKSLVTEFIAVPFVLVIYNNSRFIMWIAIILIVSMALRFFGFFRGPFMSM